MLLEPEKSKPICFRMGLNIDQPQEVIQTSSPLTYDWALQTWDMLTRTYVLTWPCVSTFRYIIMLRGYLSVRDLRVLVYVCLKPLVMIKK